MWAEHLTLNGEQVDTGIVVGSEVSGQFVSVRRWRAGEHSGAETWMGTRKRGPRAWEHELCTYPS